jgi:hypothetical protein
MPLPRRYSHHHHRRHHRYHCCRRRYRRLLSNLHRTRLAVAVLEAPLPMLNPSRYGCIFSLGSLVLSWGHVMVIIAVEEWVVGAVWV